MPIDWPLQQQKMPSSNQPLILLMIIVSGAGVKQLACIRSLVVVKEEIWIVAGFSTFEFPSLWQKRHPFYKITGANCPQVSLY